MIAFPVDPRAMYLVDPDAKPFIRNFRVDLLDPRIRDTPSAGKYTIASLRCPKGQVLLVKDLAYYVQQRVDVGLPTEYYRAIPPDLVNDYVAFEPFVNRNSPLIIDANQNAASTAAAALAGGTNAVRTQVNGVTCVSATPYKDVLNAWANWLFTFEVPSDGVFTVVFSLMALNQTAPLPNPFLVGNLAVPSRRIDFAGVYVSGITMSAQAYAAGLRNLAQSRRQ